MVPVGSENSVVGNTRTHRISPAVHWRFTLNNWSVEERTDILDICLNKEIIKNYCFQEETGEKGTPHLQGYIEFQVKHRPKEIFINKRIKWLGCKKPKAAAEYCQKPYTRTGQTYTNMKFKKPLKGIITQLHGWQQQVEAIVREEPDDRTIHWYWEPTGNVGKSALCKYLAVHYDALCVSGRGGDVKYAVMKYIEDKGYDPEIILYDIPRFNQDYINFEALESIKNGLFFSNKYESKQIIMNCPHIICFSNQPPDISMMSKDRWNIVKIDKNFIYDPDDTYKTEDGFITV